MLVRTLFVLSFLAALSACGEEEKPACCAIEPKAKCDAALHGLKVTQEEHEAMFGPGKACPSAVMSMERIRELDSQWPQACRESGSWGPLQRLNETTCPDVSLSTISAPVGVDQQTWSACGAGLKARGLKDNELWVMLHHWSEICPNAGVTETRIREILDKDWEAAGCTFATKTEMLKPLEAGACGGDAG